MGSRGGRREPAPGAVPLTWTRAYLNFATNRYQKLTWSCTTSARTPTTSTSPTTTLHKTVSSPGAQSLTCLGHRRSVKNCQQHAPTERQYALLHPWTDCYVLGTVPPPLSHHPQNSRHTTRRTVKRTLGTTAVIANTRGVKNITPRQMGSRELRHRASSDKNVASLVMARERLGDSADNTRDATLGWLKSGTGVPGPRLGYRGHRFQD